MVNINGCVCFSPSYRSKRRWKISCFLPRRLWVRWLIQKNDESRLARETFDAFSWHKNLPSLSDSVHKPRSGSLTRIYFKFQTNSLKGILHQKILYRLNLIFWIVMGSGIARFGRRGLKTTETWKFWSQILSPGVLRRGAPGVSRHSTMGFRGAAHW